MGPGPGFPHSIEVVVVEAKSTKASRAVNNPIPPRKPPTPNTSWRSVCDLRKAVRDGPSANSGYIGVFRPTLTIVAAGSPNDRPLVILACPSRRNLSLQPTNRTSSQQRGWARRSPSTSALTTEGQFGAPAGAGVNSGYTRVFRPARTAVAAQSLGVQPWVVVACSSMRNLGSKHRISARRQPGTNALTAKGEFGAPAGACANSGYARVFRPTWTTVAAKSLSMQPWVVVVRLRMKKGRRPLRKPPRVWLCLAHGYP